MLTLNDSEERRRYLNARKTITSLHNKRVIPIINENDTVATEEIRYGDNDRLAARVAQMIDADLLIMLSDVDGLYTESPTKNKQAIKIVDIKKIADIAHEHETLLVVDNCFCTPSLQLPLTLGADIVIHSATKYLDGQGRCIGGAIVGSDAILSDDIYTFLRTGGTTMSPFNAWVFLKGLETLSIRMRAHCENALQIADWLDNQKSVEKVYFPGLKSHPQHELAKTQQSGFGGVVSFEVKGNKSNAWQLIDSVNFFSITANLGDTKSTITHPATTTHHRLTEKQQVEAGIHPNLSRLSVGLEDVSDLISALDQVLCK